jgi:hypothetical protein
MKPILYLSIICLGLFFSSCKDISENLGYIDDNEALVENLNKVKGDSRTYNDDFKILEETKSEGVNYYEPNLISEALSHIPTEMKEAIHLPAVNDLPFTPGTQKANIVTFWNDSNKLIFQIQIAYFQNDAEYKADNFDFFIISATQLADNPFIDTEAKDDPIDKWIVDFNMDGTSTEPEDKIIYQKLELTPELPLFYKKQFDKWATMYPYYAYNADQKLIDHTSTGSQMYYAWHDGLIFQIGYNMDTEGMDMEAMIKEIILGK